MPDRSTPSLTGAMPPDAPVAAEEPFEARAPASSGGLRRKAARGTLINAVFQIGLAGLELLKRLLVVAFLTQAEFGFWGILLVSLTTLLWLKQVGISDKYVQQSEEDQEAAFQKAFTLELFYTLGFFLIALAALPAYAAIYGLPEMLLPGFVLSLTILASAFQTPAWIFYRNMQFVRQRVLEAISPVLTFAVTVPLAVTGAGYWSLVIGSLVGTAVAAAVSVAACPYPLRIRFDRETLREYFGFSWPLLIVGGSGLVIVQASVLVGESTVGLAGVGIIGLGATITSFGNQVNAIVTRTIYPAVCAVRDRTELLFEAFTKSNRLALMWGMPFGLGLVLFAPDLVTYGLGEDWRSAVGVLQAFGAIVAANQIGFNWTAFMRATNNTRPMAVNGVVAMVTFLAVGVPLMYREGVTGFAAGMAAVTIVQLVARGYYLRRLFADFGMVRHIARAAVPSVPAVAIVLGVRALEPGGRSLGMALGELAAYLAATIVVTGLAERRLLKEVAGYLRRPPRPAATATG